MFYNRMTVEVMKRQLSGAPEGGEFHEQALDHESTMGDAVYRFLNEHRHDLRWNVVECITILLLGFEDRKATKTQLLRKARALPWIHRMLNKGTRDEELQAEDVLEAIRNYLDEERLKFDVNFPPEDYLELRTEPKRSEQLEHSTALSRWHAKVGLEMLEEEQDPESSRRYAYDFNAMAYTWDDYFDEEFDLLRSRGTRAREYVFVLPPGLENVVFAARYRKSYSKKSLDQYSCHMLMPVKVDTARRAEIFSPSASPSATFNGLPTEIKVNILRLVLVFPGKIRVTAAIRNDGTRPVRYFDQLRATSYTFQLAYKVPKFMIRTPTSPNERGYYSDLESPEKLLAVCNVSKEIRKLAKEIFYGENYFEALDDCMSYRAPSHYLEFDFHRNGGEADGQSTQRWLELMSTSRFRDGSLRYDEPPLQLIRKLNVDLGALYYGNGFVSIQTAWHFDRIINALISMPRLEKLVINVRVSFLRDEYEGLYGFLYARPELWPGLRKLPWARSKPRVFIPEHRAAQRWLQALIDSPDDDKSKIALVSNEDWNTNQSPPGMITDALGEACQRHIDALMLP